MASVRQTEQKTIGSSEEPLSGRSNVCKCVQGKGGNISLYAHALRPLKSFEKAKENGQFQAENLWIQPLVFRK